MLLERIQDIPFDAMWQARHSQTIEEARSFWESRAREFQDITLSKDKEERRELVAWLEEKGAFAPGFAVLDLGCGAGRYALEFAPSANHITGIDISPQMIAFAVENARDAGARNTTFEALPWQDLDLASRGWEGAFDLVFASMSPAIESEETLLRFHAASRRHCFMSGFIHRTDMLRKELVRRILPGTEEPPHEGSIYFAMNVLWQNGIYADVACRNVQWVNRWDRETALAAYEMPLREFFPATVDVKRRLIEALDSMMQNGMVERRMEAKTAWLYWHKG